VLLITEGYSTVLYISYIHQNFSWMWVCICRVTGKREISHCQILMERFCLQCFIWYFDFVLVDAVIWGFYWGHSHFLSF